MTRKKWVHDPLILGNDPNFLGVMETPGTGALVDGSTPPRHHAMYIRGMGGCHVSALKHMANEHHFGLGIVGRKSYI